MSLIYKDGQYYGKGGSEMPAEDMAEVASPMPSVMSRRFKYSTEEQVVGEWIDGKPIYQKTIAINATGTWNGEKYLTSSITHGISNIDIVLSVLLIDTVNKVFNNAGGYVDGNILGIKFLQQSTYNYAILQYTKTTD